MKNFIYTLFIAIIMFGLVWIFYARENRVKNLGGEDMRQKETTDNIINNANNGGSVEENQNAKIENKMITLKTNKGDIKLELFAEQMPITTGNFLKLAKEGYYDNTKFHRVIAGFMIQGGDSNSKGDDTMAYGTGGPGYTIEDEFVAGLSNTRGTISMANTGRPNSGGAQFFINLVDNTGLDFDKEPLTSKHPVFGKVVGGMDVVDAIGSVPTDARDLPIDAVVIESIVIEE